MSLKVPKKKVPLIVNFVGEKSIRGNIFLCSQSPFRVGEELVIDLLNEEDPFFPFEIENPPSIRFISKRNIMSADTSEDSASEEGVGKKEEITVLLSDGQKLSGELLIEQPEHKSRVLDFFNSKEKGFFKLSNKTEIHYVNIEHVDQVIPS